MTLASRDRDHWDKTSRWSEARRRMYVRGDW